MDLNFYLAAMVGFVPSFGILYFAWGKLEGLFSEKKLFFNYFIGWIIGIVLSVIFLMSMVSVWQYFDLSVLFVIFFSMFMELVMYVFLNRRKVRGDYSLTYYGFALGLGFAAIWNVSLTYYYLRMPMSTYDYALATISFILLSLGMAAMNASTGALMGYGIYKNEWEKYLLMSFGLQIVFNLTLLPYIWNLPVYTYFFGVFISIPVLYYKVYKGVLLYTIPKKVMRKWRGNQE